MAAAATRQEKICQKQSAQSESSIRRRRHFMDGRGQSRVGTIRLATFRAASLASNAYKWSDRRAANRF